MPILYIHGVNTRDHKGFLQIKPYLRRIVAPAISDEPNGVLIDDCYWGDMAAKFAWDGNSRPRSRLLGQGAADTRISPADLAMNASSSEDLLRRIPLPPPAPARAGGLISGGAAPASRPAKPLRLSELEPDALGNLLAVLIGDTEPDPERKANLVMEADALAHDAAFRAQLAAADTPEKEISLVMDRLQAHAADNAKFVGMGAAGWLSGLRDRVGETLRRGSDLPAYVLSTVTGEWRAPLNDFISAFLGDVFAYLNNRLEGQAPGPIPRLALSKLRECHENKLKRGGEPIVLLSHSMGGQIVYDALTYFLDRDDALQDIRVDFWCATASQVGFFEEMKLFLASSKEYYIGVPVPFPGKRLGAWWNVWDYNDFISYTVKDIVAGVDDGPFDSGMSLLQAHGGYLECPSFYRKFAGKIRSARGV